MISEAIERAKQFLRGRKGAYCRVFQGTGLDGAAVMTDLVRFCRGTATAFHADPRLHALMEGRREVLLRIQQHLNLDDEALWRLYQPTKGE